MKTYFVALFTGTLLFGNFECLQGAPVATGQPTQTEIPPPTPFAATKQDGNSRVWERTVYELAPDGTVVPKKHSYTELATGLNHLVNGQWVESSEQIDIQPNGTASATQGQHQAYFPGDIYNGEIELVTPDGVQLHSRPMGLSYFDGQNSVLIAELTNSIGVVSGANQVIYPNAFTDFKADLVYTYTKAGFQQDIVLREQPPTPESFGLNPATARLEVLTEFFDPPQPTIQSTAMPEQAGLALTDQSLGFGAMQMIPGRAFLLGENAVDAGVMVGKQWQLLGGRQFLVEEVPVDALAGKLAELPLPTVQSSSRTTTHIASKHLTLPPQRLVKTTPKTMPMARASIPSQGLVLDYVTVNSAFTNYIFQGDTTYYISHSLSLFGANIFEGGSVIKYTNGASMLLVPIGSSTVKFQSSAYRPVIFTAKDDNSVGEAISGSTGSPSGYYANPALYLPTAGSPTLQNLRIAYAQQAINVPGTTLTLSDAQLINCQNGISLAGSPAHLRNVLFANVLTDFNNVAPTTMEVQNTTFNNSVVLATSNSLASMVVICTNCILANVTNMAGAGISLSGDHNGFYNSGGGSTFGTSPITVSSYPFQSAGGGNYYLTNGCGFFNAGTTNINPTLLADIRTKTTYPPIVYTNSTFSVATTFSPQAQRDTDTPDLGYHYDPLDYGFGGCTTVSNITFTAGTAVGWFRTSSGWYHAGYGIYLQEYVLAAFNGTATSPCYWARLDTVQEQDNSGGYGPGGIDGEYNPGSNDTSTSPVAQLNFTRCSMMSYDGNHFRDDYGYLIVNAANSEFWGGGLGGYIILGNFTNCLLDRCSFGVQGDDSGARSLVMRNCLMRGTYLYVSHSVGATWPVSIINSAFDGTDLSSVDTNSLACDYNAFLTNHTRLPVFGTHDVTNVISFNWQSNWFGNYYQPTNSPLIDKGSTNANYLGLYHFTTQTNQVKEANSIVDIGYHYVATDTNGIPLDTNGDGIPDYLEDANGNGLVDSGEIGWNITGDLGLKVLITRPRNGSILP